MKKKNFKEKVLSFEKFTVAELNKLNVVIGGTANVNGGGDDSGTLQQQGSSRACKSTQCEPTIPTDI